MHSWVTAQAIWIVYICAFVSAQRQQAMTNVDINSGAIDGANIGAASRGTAAFTTLDANGNVTLGSDANDVITINGEITASVGMLIKDNQKLYFGDGFDASIEYDEDGDDELKFAGAAVAFAHASCQ